MKPPLQLRDEGRVFDVLGKGVSPDDVAILDVQLQHLHVVDGQHLSKIDLVLVTSLTRTLYFSRMYSCGCDWNRARSTSLHVNRGSSTDWPRLMRLLLSTAISSLVRRSFTRSEAGGTA